MPSPDQLFRLDPVQTKVEAPRTQFQALTVAADRTVANRSLNRGLQTFSTALGSLATFKKQEQINEDIKTAKDAAAREQVMPNGLLPVAQDAYRNIVDKNTAHSTLLEIDKFTKGEQFDALLNSPDIASSTKTDEVEKSFEEMYLRASRSIQNPDVLAALRNNVNTLKEKAYNDVYEIEKNHRTVEGINAISNTIKDAVAFSAITDTPLEETFTEKWVNNIAKDLGVSHSYIPENERKLIAFQQLTANPDILDNPEVIYNLLNKQFNKGFTYHNLYFGKGEDSKEFKQVYDDFLQKSAAHQKRIADQEKASDKVRVAEAKSTVQEVFLKNPNMDLGELGPTLLNSGMEPGKVNTYLKGLKTYNDTVIKEAIGSDDYNQVRDLILKGVIQDNITLGDFGIAGNLSKEAITNLEKYVGAEGSQRAANVKTYLKSTGTIRSTLVGLIKTNLKGKSDKIQELLLEGGEPSMADLARMVAGTSLNPDELRVALNEVNDLIVDMESLAETNAFNDAAAEGDGSVPSQNIQAFQSHIKTAVEALAEKVNRALTENQFSHLDADPSSSLNPVTFSSPETPLPQSSSSINTPSASGSGAITSFIPSQMDQDSFFVFSSTAVRNMKLDAQNRAVIQGAVKGEPQGLIDKIMTLIIEPKPPVQGEPSAEVDVLSEATKNLQDALNYSKVQQKASDLFTEVLDIVGLGGVNEDKSVPVDVDITDLPGKAETEVQPNNPFNIEKGVGFDGEVDSADPRFASFDSTTSGLRGGILNFLTKFEKGLSISEVVEKISPKADNNPTDKMIAEVLRATGLKATDSISLDDSENIKNMAKSLLKWESPNKEFKELDEAVKLAIEEKNRQHGR